MAKRSTMRPRLHSLYKFNARIILHKQLLASLSLQGAICVVTSLVPEATGVLQAPSLVA